VFPLIDDQLPSLAEERDQERFAIIGVQNCIQGEMFKS